MADTFQAAPQRAAAAGYSSPGYGSSAPAGGAQGAAPASPPAAPTAGATGDIKQQVQAIVGQVGQIAQLVGQIAPEVAGGAAAPGGAAGPVNLANVTGDPRLQQAMQEIARDPEGARLAQAAQARGLNLQVGQLPPGVMGLTQGNNITISPQAVGNKPDLIHTLAHELGHAATPADGDSLAEEQAVDQLGQRIQQRIAPGPTFQLDIGGYRGLPQDNGIRNSLAQIGL